MHSINCWVMTAGEVYLHGSGKLHIHMSYSDSPHCSYYLHPAARATHLQTANVLQNVRERLKDLQFDLPLIT